MGLLCAVLNYRFAFRIGFASSEVDGYILGAIAVVVEVFLWVAPIAGAYHHRMRRFSLSAIAWSLWTLCAMLSFLNTVGYIATSREATARQAGRETAAFSSADTTAGRLRAEISHLTRRSVSRIEADIKALPLVEADRQARKLKSIELMAELADARHVLEIQARLDGLQPALLAGKPASGDPAATLLGTRMGISLEDAQLFIAVIFGFTGLAVSSLGPLALRIEEGAWQERQLRVVETENLEILHVEELPEIPVDAEWVETPRPLSLPARW